MPQGYFVEVRKLQKKQLLQFIQDNNDKSLELLLGLYSQQTGLKVSTLKIYIEEMQSAGLIKIDKGFIIND